MAVVKDEAERGNEALTASAQASVQFKRCTRRFCVPLIFDFWFLISHLCLAKFCAGVLVFSVLFKLHAEQWNASEFRSYMPTTAQCLQRPGRLDAL